MPFRKRHRLTGSFGSFGSMMRSKDVDWVLGEEMTPKELWRKFTVVFWQEVFFFGVAPSGISSPKVSGT